MTKRRAADASAKVDLNMTPMIDVVFQLLTFFLMTFKVAAAEGDFSLRLPLHPSVAPPNLIPDLFNLRLTAGANGELASMTIVGEKPFVGPAAFAAMRRRVAEVARLTLEIGRETPEIEIDADDGLRYEYVVRTIDAVSGRIDDAGEIVPLVRKISFSPKRE